MEQLIVGGAVLKPNKYILHFGQIHFEFIQMTNSFLNLSKYISKFVQIHVTYEAAKGCSCGTADAPSVVGGAARYCNPRKATERLRILPTFLLGHFERTFCRMTYRNANPRF